MVIGLLSWLGSLVLSLPITWAMCNGLGIALLNTPMDVAFSPNGYIYWLIIVVVVSSLASILPARNASRLTVREVLAYE